MRMWTKYLIYLVSNSVSIGIAIWLLKSKMKQTSEKESWAVFFFFLTNFSCSFGLYALLLQEILYFKNSADNIQTQLWHFEISILNFNIIFLGPFLLLKRITDRIRYEKIRKIGFWVLLFVYLYYLARKLNQEVSSLNHGKKNDTLMSYFTNIFVKEAQFNILGNFNYYIFFLIMNMLTSISVDSSLI